MFGFLSSSRKGEKISLNHAHDKIRREVEALQSRLEQAKTPELKKPATIEQLLREKDQDLAALYRQMKSAQRDVSKLRRENGPEDAMLEIAEYAYESARGRYQTRLIELEEDEELYRTARAEAEKQKAIYNQEAIALAARRREQERIEREHMFMTMVMILIGMLMSRNVKTLTIARGEDLPQAVLRIARETGLDQIGRTIGHVANPAFRRGFGTAAA